MQKLLFLIGLVVFPITTIAENLLINPGFDETPWDTGWTVDTGSSSTEGAGASVDASPDTRCHSSPRSCELYAGAAVCYHLDYSRSASAGACVFQEIPPVINCTCRVYFKNKYWKSGLSLHRAGWSVDVFVKINNEWASQWSTSEANLIWAEWEKIYGASDTVSGIKFCASAWASISDISNASGYAWFWIDDIYISGTEVGVEERTPKPELQKPRLAIYPNPFKEFTVISYQIN